MNCTNIKSLSELQARKAEVKEDICFYEKKMKEDYYKLTHPFQNSSLSSILDQDNNLSLERISKAVVKAKRIVDVVKIGISIYKLYKK